MDRLDLYVMHPFAAARMKILTESVFYKHLLAIVRNLRKYCLFGFVDGSAALLGNPVICKDLIGGFTWIRWNYAPNERIVTNCKECAESARNCEIAGRNAENAFARKCFLTCVRS